MLALLRTIINSNHFLKITALFFGYSLWVILSQQQVTSIRIEVPLCFSNTHDILIQNAPETISVELRGKRKYLQTINYKLLAAHVNAQELNAGINILSITEEQLLLPSCITLTMSIPVQVNITRSVAPTEQTSNTP